MTGANLIKNWTKEGEKTNVNGASTSYSWSLYKVGSIDGNKKITLDSEFESANSYIPSSD